MKVVTNSARSRAARFRRLGLAALLAVTSLASAVSPSAPEGGGGAAVVSKVRLVLLGTGAGPIAQSRRGQPSNALVIQGRLFLIDTGEGVSRQLVGAGFNPEDVERIFYTHLHFDHTIGLGPLLGYNWMTQRARRYAIVGPPGTKKFAGLAVAYASYPIAIYAAQMPRGPTVASLLDISEVEVSTAQVIYRDSDVTVTAVRNSHYDTIPANRIPGATLSYSLRFDTAHRSIVFTGDSGYSDAVVALARGADILVSEVMDMARAEAFVKSRYGAGADILPMLAHVRQEHMSPDDVGRLAAKAGVKMVVLSHLGLAKDGDRGTANFSAGVHRHYRGPVVVGQDRMSFEM